MTFILNLSVHLKYFYSFFSWVLRSFIEGFLHLKSHYLIVILDAVDGDLFGTVTKRL